MSLWSRLANVFRAGSVEGELDEELQFHVDERIRELTAAGMTRQAAAEQVARRFGNPLRLREQSRDVKLLPWLDSLVRDIRLGLRMLRKNAVVTGAALVSLSLAVGACVAAFSLVDALILRPLPVRHPEQLIYLTFPNVHRCGDGRTPPSRTAARIAAHRSVDARRVVTALCCRNSANTRCQLLVDAYTRICESYT